MKIVIIGKNGLAGGALIRHALSLRLCEGLDFVSLDLPDFDVASRRFALETLNELKPEVIVNATGVTLIDWLEKKPNTARTIHVQGTANLREAAKRNDALLVQISCAEVFGQDQASDLAGGDRLEAGVRSEQLEVGCEESEVKSPPHTSLLTPHSKLPPASRLQAPASLQPTAYSLQPTAFSEACLPEPVSVYGKTKLDGERAAGEAPRHLIVRTGPLFGATGQRCGTTGQRFGKMREQSGNNLVETLLHSLRRKEKMYVVNDLWASYTWTDDLARTVFALIERACTGLYHVANAGMATPFDMAREIARQTGIRREYEPMAAADYGFVAPRARYTVLDTAKYDAVEGVPRLPDWQSALDAYLATRSVVSG